MMGNYHVRFGKGFLINDILNVGVNLLFHINNSRIFLGAALSLLGYTAYCKAIAVGYQPNLLPPFLYIYI